MDINVESTNYQEDKLYNQCN